MTCREDCWRGPGKGSHAATPQYSKDAVVIASNIVGSLQTFVSRMCDPFEPVVLTVGEMSAGSNWNVIAETAQLSGTVRTFNQDLFRKIPALLSDFITNAVSTFSATAEIEISEITGPLVNDIEVTKKIAHAASRTPGVTEVNETYRTMGAEDFSFMLYPIDNGSIER